MALPMARLGSSTFGRQLVPSPVSASLLMRASLLSSSSRSLHSRSHIPRGRAAINADAGRRRVYPRESNNDRRSSNPTKSDNEAASSKEQQQEEAMRKASQNWPSWLPKPASIAAFELRERAGATGPTARSVNDEPEQIFIPKGSPQHSSSRKTEQPQASSLWGWLGSQSSASSSPSSSSSSNSSDRYTREEDWPSWLPPRGRPPPRHPVSGWYRNYKRVGFLSSIQGLPKRKAFRFLVVLVGAGGVYYVSHLETIPYTGRTRFRDVSEEEAVRLGDEASASIIAGSRHKLLSPSHPHSVQARRVASRLIKAAECLDGSGFIDVELGDADAAALASNDDTRAKNLVRRTKWQVFVIEDPEPNASVFPNGHIFVNTGIIPICRDDDGLATVLGHEIAHKLCAHSAEKLSGSKVSQAITIILALSGLDWGLSSVAMTLLQELPNSRRVECEADDLGLKLMSRACYDPEKAPGLWQRMREAQGGKDGGAFAAMLSTHPLSQDREETLQKAVPAARIIRDAANCPPKSMITNWQRQMGGGLTRGGEGRITAI